ncbi:EVE domain-containing protein [Algicola sagamiensis]|uniref:EVE domain-containing protein n=1 Tax=Algicola sagamiensis TaxID=163869 RepID=UPI0003665215|nr:EVE domain-containing protein [Algicola sagamiensis]
MAVWLFKSEPDAFSIDDLAKSPEQKTIWDGVRNYQARNFLRDDVKVGDTILYYHSSCKVPGIVGLAEVTRGPIVDPSQFDNSSPYFDAKSEKASPRWITVEIEFKEKLDQIIPLTVLKNSEALQGFPLVKKGNRLSIIPVSPSEYQTILEFIK